MLIKKKICAGHDGQPHPAIIYKNINGKKFCLFCTFKLEGSKMAKKNPPKKEDKDLSKKQKELFFEIWNERMINGLNYCEVTGELIHSPHTYNFDHLLEKSKYPELRFNKDNIIIISADAHSKKTNGFPLPAHLKRINWAKENLL